MEKPLPAPPRKLHPLCLNIKGFYGRSLQHHLRKTQTYRFTVQCNLWTAICVLLINVVVTIWATHHYKVKDQMSTLYHGSCGKVKSYSFWSSFFINILGTILVGGCSYSMQCLSSPTREEVDAAHSRGHWLHIGVPNTRNLLSISRYRLGLWCLLTLASIPLHLLYNSVVFSTLSTRSYSAFLISSDYLDRPLSMWNLSGALDSPRMEGFRSWGNTSRLSLLLEQHQEGSAPLKNLSNEQCIDAYTASTISAYRDVLLVASPMNSTQSLIASKGLGSVLFTTSEALLDDSACMNSWPCDGDTCKMYADPDDANSPLTLDAEKSTLLASNWKVNNASVQYCLAQTALEECELQFSLTYMITVILCNVIMICCMTCIVQKRSWKPLVILGDAVQSFIESPDATTEGSCVAGREKLAKSEQWRNHASEWNPRRLAWRNAVAKHSWTIIWLLLVISPVQTNKIR